MFSIVKSAEERLQHSVDDFRKQTWLEWLSLLHSDLAESELGCVQLHTCHFIGRNVAVLYLSQTYNDAKEHKIIILSLSFKNVPASIADEKHCDANCILLLAILGIERIVRMDLGSGSFFCFSKCVQGNKASLMGRILFCMLHGKGRLLPNHDLLFAKYAITLQKKNPEIPKTIRNQSLLVSVRRKSITGNDCRDRKAGWE